MSGTGNYADLWDESPTGRQPTTEPATVNTPVYCGNFVGPPHWHGLDYFEPDECDAETEVAVIPEEYGFATYVCPGCGATNTVLDHSAVDKQIILELVAALAAARGDTPA